MVVDDLWQSWKRSDKPYLGDSASDREHDKTKWPMKTFSYVTSYLDEVPSISTYFDAWFQREKELTNPLGSSDGGKYIVSQGASESSANYHYLQYLKAMKREDRRKRAAAEANVSQLYDQALEREQREKVNREKQEKVKAEAKRERKRKRKKHLWRRKHILLGCFLLGQRTHLGGSGGGRARQASRARGARGGGGGKPRKRRKQNQKQDKDGISLGKMQTLNDVDYTEEAPEHSGGGR